MTVPNPLARTWSTGNSFPPGAINGGKTLAHPPVQMMGPFIWGVRWYRVRPRRFTRTVPTPPMDLASISGPGSFLPFPSLPLADGDGRGDGAVDGAIDGA